jgi:Peptidase S24-like
MLKNSPSAAHSIRSLERSALVADILRRGRFVRLQMRVYGESMLPALWPGDVVEIEGCSPEDVRPGEIVLARRDGRLFLHRLVAHWKPRGFQLHGDSVPGADPPYPPEALLGRFVRRIDCPAPQGAPDFGEVAVSLKRSPGTSRSFSADGTAALGAGRGAEWLGVKWSRVVGMLLCHCSPARRLALKLHSRRRLKVMADESRRSGPAAEPGVL